jgi:hypothetical protein
MENRSPLEGDAGNAHFVNLNIRPVEQAMEAPKPPPAAPAPADDVAVNEGDDDDEAGVEQRVAAAKRSHARLFADAIGRELKRETAAMSRLAGRPDFMDKARAWYVQQEQHVAAAIAPAAESLADLLAEEAGQPLAAVMSAVQQVVNEYAVWYCLQATGDLAGRDVTACLSEWNIKRPGQAAMELPDKIAAAVMEVCHVA